jgi:hypothetical protein
MTEPVKKQPAVLDPENAKHKLSKFGKALVKKIEKTEGNPYKFQEDVFPFIKKTASKDIEALETLFQISITSGNPFEFNEGMIEYIRNHEDIKKVLGMYFDLYKNFSDTPDEALWVGNLLNEVEDDKLELLKIIIDLYGSMGQHEKQMELLEKTKEKFPDNFDDIELAQRYLYSELPEYIEKGKKIIEGIDIEKVDLIQQPGIGALKFYSGINYDGLIYHFGGEDFRPKNFVSKKPIPNSKTHDFNGKSVVVTTYRGMGDSMILSRFLPKFMEKWPECKITIATEPSMVPLYKAIPGLKSVGTMESHAGKMFDHCLGVNMLSRYLRDQLVDENGCVPYHEWVAYPESYDIKWKEIINKDETKPLVGINWKGSQRLGGGNERDNRNTTRDLELREFIGIVDLHPNYNFVVLNNDIWEEERAMLLERPNVLLTNKLKDFGDTAAAIKLCDVVVSIDTSVSTLSASMSKDTIVLAKFWPDYRWLYYEKWWDLTKMNVQVFRKEKYNDGWAIPVMKTAVSLRNYAK